MRNPLVIGIWLLRICVALLAAVWLYQDGAAVRNSVESVSTPVFFLIGGGAFVLFGMSFRRSRVD